MSRQAADPGEALCGSPNAQARPKRAPCTSDEPRTAVGNAVHLDQYLYKYDLKYKKFRTSPVLGIPNFCFNFNEILGPAGQLDIAHTFAMVVQDGQLV
jgi:hypothetical protein